MSKLLIFIGENQKFDATRTVAAIHSIPGVSSAQEKEVIGAIFECHFTHEGRTTVARISKDLETVTVEGLGDESLYFALRLQEQLGGDLSAIDMDYSFHVSLRDIRSVDDFRRIIAAT